MFSDPSTSSYVDNDVDWSTEYYYALKNTDTDNNSAWSNECSITTPSSGGGGNSYPDSVVATIKWLAIIHGEFALFPLGIMCMW